MNTLAGRTAGLMASIVESGVASHSLSIVIPAYNEELRIGKVLQELCDFITLEHAPWHVIVAVDGDDNTETVVLNFAKNYPFISYNTSEERRGKGSLCLSLFLQLKCTCRKRTKRLSTK